MTTYELPGGGVPEVSTEGSIFSMEGPAGAVAPVVAYDFTGAASLAAANLSGDSSLDLVAVGTPTLGRFAGTFATPHVQRPLGAAVDGKALHTGSGQHASTSGSPAAVRLMGAMTAEWLGYVPVAPGGGVDLHLFFCAASGETLATNALYQLFWFDFNDNWEYRHENGAGSDSTVGFYTTAVSDFAEMRFAPQMMTLTRASDGTCRLFVNGGQVADAALPTPVNLPEGGTAAELVLGFAGGAATAARLATLAFRLFNVELTPAQVLASYHRTFFGVTSVPGG